MKFSDPYWLLAGVLTSVVLIAMWYRYDARQRTALAKFVAPHLRSVLTGSVSRVRRFMQRALFLGAVLCLCAALAGPLVGYHWESITRRGNEVVFAIDTSRSMLTADVKPNRLTRAKLAIDDMARQLDGDGIGIVAFAGSSFLFCPLTLDYNAFRQSLDAIDIHTIPRGGTNIPSAIEAARAALSHRPGSDRILILVTDGENLEGDALSAAAEAAKQDGLKIYTVGIGTTEGDLIPLPSDQGGGSVQDEKGAFVKSHLDESGLKAIAAAAGGAYVHLEGQGQDFETFLGTVFGAVSKHDLRYRQQKVYNERYQWPLAASLVLLLASLSMGTRRSNVRRAAAKSRVSAESVGAAAVAALAALAMVMPTRSETAEQTNAPVSDYNAGTSAYRAGQFDQATQAFQQSIRVAPASNARRLADQQDSYYNLGNALYRAGQQFEKSAPQQAIEKWTAAVKAYDTALQLRAGDADSKYNRDFVKRKIDALQKPPDQGGGGGGGGGGGQGKGNSQGKGNGQGQGQPPPGQAAAPPPPPTQTAGAPPNAPAPTPADNQRAPGQMSTEEARELLDSAKSEEHPSLGVPSGPRDPDQPPDKAFKNW